MHIVRIPYGVTAYIKEMYKRRSPGFSCERSLTEPSPIEE